MGRIEFESSSYEPMPIVGYCDAISVMPGSSIRFYVSCDGAAEFGASIVRLIHGEVSKQDPNVGERLVASSFNRTYPGHRQTTHPGSCMVVDKLPPAVGAQLSGQAMICPTAPGNGLCQAIVSQWCEEAGCGWTLHVDTSGHLAFRAGLGESTVISLSKPLITGLWYLVGVSADARTGTIELFQEPVAGAYNSRLALRPPTESLDDWAINKVAFQLPQPNTAPLMIAAWRKGTRPSSALVSAAHYNGKIDRPRVAARCLSRDEMRRAVKDPLSIEGIVGAWDFASNITAHGVTQINLARDAGPHGLNGRLRNMPTRGVTGYNWDGSEYCFRHKPSQYGAIHFHDDDLIDCGWEPSCDFAIPDDLPSGIYAAKVSATIDGVMEEDYIPFFVRPAPGTKHAPIAYLAATASYLAYANDMFSSDYADIDALAASTTQLGESALARNQHREYGASLYDLHSDGSGICYSSWLRPILTVRPKVRHHSGLRSWQFNADLNMIAWFERMNLSVDVLTDHDLHAEGVGLLRDYKLVVTGTHPEYYSGKMLDSLHRFVEHEGGRLMYMGGNGFYWVTAFHDEDPRIVEIRRWGGTQSWAAAPGEQYLSLTGEMGGLWRERGRPPQKLTGVGFIAQGQDRAGYFERNPDSTLPEAEWIFEGLSSDGRIGDYGPERDGAAGLELDWYDPRLGSPGWAHVIASSRGHSRFMLEARENLGSVMPFVGGDMNAKVRADMVYFKTMNDGAVFSTGSISWCEALSHQDYDNDVSRLTLNVASRFATDAPLP